MQLGFIYIFWVTLAIPVFSYILYPVIIAAMAYFKKYDKTKSYDEKNLPTVTLFIAAYNEANFVEEKVKNIQSLLYPKEKLKILFVTDGSNDGTNIILEKYKSIQVLHNEERKGKTAAINRGMKYVNTEITVFSDCNTKMNPDALKKLIQPFSNAIVGCVAGEKRIVSFQKDIAVNSGEGLYWKYEAFLKSKESKIHSSAGAAGELFAIRTSLFENVDESVILDDFVISMSIALKKFKIKYVPDAFSIETASASIKEELKRKIRISSGAFQAVNITKSLLNPFKCGMLSFIFFSHKFLRWTMIPFLLPIIFAANILIIFNPCHPIYIIMLGLQTIFYFSALLGYVFSKKKIKATFLFAPYYFFIMHYAAYQGFIRYIMKRQSVSWERAKRG
jgi:cellulose synthase/poly-beta-1,6-N-acetylglucosamine synthase-like glycosyltransferase